MIVMMQVCDFIYGHNYIDQMQANIRDYFSVEHLLIRHPSSPIDWGFNWRATRQGFTIWNRRGRMFDLYFRPDRLANLSELPRNACSLNDDPLFRDMDSQEEV